MKQRFIFTFPTETIDIPVSWHLIMDFGLKLNIFNAYINAGEEGNLALELEGEHSAINSGIKFVRSKGVLADPIEKHISIRKESCVHCGACTAVCYPGALELSADSRLLSFNAKKCTVCESCTTACPLRLIKIRFTE